MLYTGGCCTEGLAMHPTNNNVYFVDINFSYNINDDGGITFKKILYEFNPIDGGFDDITIDAEGNIWGAVNSFTQSGSKVISSAGEVLASYSTPFSLTNCSFGISKEKSLFYHD
jgi:sugar lactone lactonase YvrE